jgi:membrane protease YdiL (CAAX protease family)
MLLKPTPIESNLLKAVVPLVMIGFVLLVARRRRLSFRDTLGFAAPAPGAAALWIGVYIAWMLATNAVMGWRGPWDFEPWRNMPLMAAILRVLAVAIIGPIAEELVFRGLFYALLVGRIGWIATVLGTALVWSCLHYAESPAVIALFFVDGVLLGAARHHTRSLYVPIAMHVTWNLYAIW